MTTPAPPAHIGPAHIGPAHIGHDASGGSAAPVVDAPPGNWVDAYAPKSWRPYLRLARLDRPIGAWLLLFPCWWSLVLASIADGRALPNPWHLVLLGIGAFVMRGAGCAYNDVVDRDFDAQVARSISRPIPSGQASVARALAFAVALALVGLLVLLQFDTFTIWLAISSLALVAIYPFMKRLTNWPQLVLGLTFNWGALVGWSTLMHGLGPAPLLLYAGSVLWTLGYDTIYAHQDKEDDLMLGLKSTALHFGTATWTWVSGFYAAALVLWTLAAVLVGAGWPTFLALALVGAHFLWQVRTLDIDAPDNCLKRFRSNRDVGFLLFAGLLLDRLIAWAGMAA